MAARAWVATLQGRRGAWFAGAHLGHGFQEDGLASAVRVAKALGTVIPREEARVGGALQQIARPQVVTPDFPPIRSGAGGIVLGRVRD